MREGEFRNSSGCAIACIFHQDQTKENGARIKECIAMMHERSNGLGGGFAAYGIYPAYKDAYALHVFFDDTKAKVLCEEYLHEYFHVVCEEEIPTKKDTPLQSIPLIWRYFLYLKPTQEPQVLIDFLFMLHKEVKGAYVCSCGKNMGVFKGVGYPEDIADFYMLETYMAHTWIAHGRYPTNTPGWWAGAHPFSMLDIALVHNGEISSYDANRRNIEMYGYHCDLLTDTEVITYMLDFMHRKKGLSFEECAQIIAAPFWSQIDAMTEDKRRYYTMLRRNFASFLISGPFSIIVGSEDGIFALNDRCKLRSLMVAQKGHTYYLASEESAIRKIQMEIDDIYSLDGGIPFIKRRGVDTNEER